MMSHTNDEESLHKRIIDRDNENLAGAFQGSAVQISGNMRFRARGTCQASAIVLTTMHLALSLIECYA